MATLRERLEAHEAYEHAIALLLSSHRDKTDDYDNHFGSTPFAGLYRKRRVLLRDAYWPYLVRALVHRDRWIRRPETWQAQGHSPRAILWSLVRHLHCRYGVATFWLGEWLRDDRDFAAARVRAFSAVGQGESYYALARDGRLGVELTRRECHVLSTVHGASTLEAAVRTSQVLARGGPRWLARALARGPWAASLERPSVEERRAHAIAWMCRRPELEPADLPAILHVVDVRRDLSLVGRTVASVRRVVPRPPAPPRRPPHDPGSAPLQPVVRRWGPSRLQPLGDRGHPRPSWTVTELRNTTQLLCEGRAMSHCVERYEDLAVAGTCSLWSVRARGLPVLTLEVRGDRIVQARGHANRHPTTCELALVRRWARLNALHFD